MPSRRRFMQFTTATLAALGATRLLPTSRSRADQATPQTTQQATSAAAPTASGSRIWAPLIAAPLPTATPTAIATRTPEPTPTITAEPTSAAPLPTSDGRLLGPPSGSAEQAIAWLAPRAVGYTETDVRAIVGAYKRIGDAGGVDWFLALAQMCLETGSLTSWWSQRPRRNPAGIGVTGSARPGSADAPPNGDGFRWAFRDGLWYEGVSFDKWDTDGVAAHIGRILAYALVAPQNTNQQQIIDWALYVRPMPARQRGIAQTITDLNGRWAVPGTTYGQSILALRDRMRGG